MSSCLGRTVCFPKGKMSSSLGGTASFPGRKVSSCWGRIASFPGRKVSSCQGRITSFPGRKVSNCLGDTASFPGRKVSSCLVRTTTFTRKCKYTTWALNRVQLRCQNPNNKGKNENYSQHNTNTKMNLYMVVPYYRGLSESIKRSCKKFGVQVHFKGGITIRNLLMASKDKDHILKKLESYINTLVIGWSVMNSTLGNQQGPLLKGSRNIKRLPLLYMIIPSDQVMKSTLTTSV